MSSSFVLDAVLFFWYMAVLWFREDVFAVLVFVCLFAWLFCAWDAKVLSCVEITEWSKTCLIKFNSVYNFLLNLKFYGYRLFFSVQMIHIRIEKVFKFLLFGLFFTLFFFFSGQMTNDCFENFIFVCVLSIQNVNACLTPNWKKNSAVLICGVIKTCNVLVWYHCSYQPVEALELVGFTW